MKAVVPVKEIIQVPKLVFTAALHTNSNGIHLGGVDFRFFQDRGDGVTNTGCDAALVHSRLAQLKKGEKAKYLVRSLCRSRSFTNCENTPALCLQGTPVHKNTIRIRA